MAVQISDVAFSAVVQGELIVEFTVSFGTGETVLVLTIACAVAEK
jgi:hypothetical protein